VFSVARTRPSGEKTRPLIACGNSILRSSLPVATSIKTSVPRALPAPLGGAGRRQQPAVGRKGQAGTGGGAPTATADNDETCPVPGYSLLAG